MKKLLLVLTILAIGCSKDEGNEIILPSANVQFIIEGQGVADEIVITIPDAEQGQVRRYQSFVNEPLPFKHTINGYSLKEMQMNIDYRRYEDGDDITSIALVKDGVKVAEEIDPRLTAADIVIRASWD